MVRLFSLLPALGVVSSFQKSPDRDCLLFFSSFPTSLDVVVRENPRGPSRFPFRQTLSLPLKQQSLAPKGIFVCLGLFSLESGQSLPFKDVWERKKNAEE